MSSLKLVHPEGRTLVYEEGAWTGHPADVMEAELVLLEEKLIEMDPDDFPDHVGDPVVRMGKIMELRTVWEIVDSTISPVKNGVA